MPDFPSLVPPLVSIDSLANDLDNQEVIVIDASTPKVGSSSLTENPRKVQIPGARFFDIEGAFADLRSDLPHMMPPAHLFQEAARALGLNATSRVIIYDTEGIWSAPRAWWMLKAMGHLNVSVLNGGLPQWVEKGYPTEPIKQHTYPKGDFSTNEDKTCFVSAHEVHRHMHQENVTIIDARSTGRFAGTEPEPRPGLRSGHIPGSINLPFTSVLDGHHLKPKASLKVLFDGLDIKDQSMIFSCGSGLTACIVLLAAHTVGYTNLSVYDGSWSEWGKPGDLPVEV